MDEEKRKKLEDKIDESLFHFTQFATVSEDNFDAIQAIEKNPEEEKKYRDSL